MHALVLAIALSRRYAFITVAIVCGLLATRADAQVRTTGQTVGTVQDQTVPLGGLSWRSIGPAMFAGRVADVAGVPGKPDVLYVGTASSAAAWRACWAGPRPGAGSAILQVLRSCQNGVTLIAEL